MSNFDFFNTTRLVAHAPTVKKLVTEFKNFKTFFENGINETKQGNYEAANKCFEEASIVLANIPTDKSLLAKHEKELVNAKETLNKLISIQHQNKSPSPEDNPRYMHCLFATNDPNIVVLDVCTLEDYEKIKKIPGFSPLVVYNSSRQNWNDIDPKTQAMLIKDFNLERENRIPVFIPGLKY